ncbi:hypothetical protein N7492_004816 [Penicillium capsulatum]|uniref:Ima1 N-terminal domain-containing protein n=1 Tax=Penicillium capsulatum TaxID=69766 RepID=A0A9W9LRJ0_9EURO|nr:hypothetical protein N7492_004816 [Penicillium capsulatum]KAJ6136075.1 hypothetical protein N7512_001235 [Penicillium capsulatum]
MALFPKRLTCFYCGQRPTVTVRGPVPKFWCDHCEADNYLDENGEITDPPTAETNRLVYQTYTSNPAFEPATSRESDLFCAKCVRNQHLFTNSLASFLPATDEPTDPETERQHAQYRKNLEEQYPQVCDTCEPRVRQRIRQAGYEAKADHLRRMMDRSRASKASRRKRNRSWQSLLVYIGGFCYWTSIFGQVAWGITESLKIPSTMHDLNPSSEEEVSGLSCVVQTIAIQRISSDCAYDLASFAGLALLAGCMSIWWNPQLRNKVEGRGGRFAGLGEYYQIQLIVMVSRCVFWALLKDPSASGLEANLPPALHTSMMIFIVLSIVVSRRVVKYDTRPLVDWSDNSWEKTPIRSTAKSPISAAQGQAGTTPGLAATDHTAQRFPIQKLASAQPVQPRVDQLALGPVPSQEDDMDWSPSVPHNIQSTSNVYPRNQSVLDGPSPFHGNLPPPPQPPAWAYRTQPSTKRLDEVVQTKPVFPNPNPPQPQQWRQTPSSPEPVFRPPKFFPSSDYNSTGLEALFDRAFTIEPEHEPKRPWSQHAPNPSSRSTSTPSKLIFQYLRLILLFGSLAAWTFSQNHILSLPGNYIEACALGSASLIAGFALLEALKRPLAHWNGKEVLIYVTELAAAIHLGAHLPQGSFEREYFDRYGKLLLIFMAVQEGLGLLSFYRETQSAAQPKGQQPPSPASPLPGSQLGSPRPESLHGGNAHWSPAESMPSRSPTGQSFGSQASRPSAPPLSFASTLDGSSFSTALPPTQPNYRLSSSNTFHSFPGEQPKNPHSFTMESLKESEPLSDYDQDSDSETVATNTTAHTDATTRNIRYGRNPSNLFSPRRNELGPGIGGLSLEDRPASRRMTRSQTQQGPMGRRYPGRVAF